MVKIDLVIYVNLSAKREGKAIALIAISNEKNGEMVDLYSRTFSTDYQTAHWLAVNEAIEKAREFGGKNVTIRGGGVYSNVLG